MAEPLHERWERRGRRAGRAGYARRVMTRGTVRLNWPAFLELLPEAGRLTLDLGCGEGRGGAPCASAGTA